MNNLSTFDSLESCTTPLTKGVYRSLAVLVLLLLTVSATFAQPPISDGDCGRNVLEFDVSGNTGTTSITGFDYAEGSFEAWVRKDNWSDPYDDALFSNEIGHPHSNSFYISFHSAVGLHFRYGGSEDTGNVAAYASSTSTDTLAANSWHHIAATWENDGNATTVAIYIDAQLIASTSTSSDLVLNTTNPFGLGLGVVNYLYDFQGGAMAEVSVWNVAKTQAEIELDMGRILSVEDLGLIAYWPLNDTPGSATASNLIQATETLSLLDFSDVNTSWASFPMEIKVSDERMSSGDTQDFGLVALGTSREVTFTITNQTDTSLDLLGNPAATITGSEADQFTLDLSGTATTLAAGASTTFSVSFDPQTVGVKEASLAFTTVADCSDPYTINLTGTSPDLTLSYAGAGFTEQTANDGSVVGSITITVWGDTFQDDDADNLLDIDSEVTIGNVPVGLTPILTLNSDTEAVLTLIGNASAHQSVDDVADITFEFKDAAFTNYEAASIPNATGPVSGGAGIDFDDNPIMIYSGEGFVETITNDGSVSGSIFMNLSTGSFATKSSLVYATDYSINNLPEGLVPNIAISNTTLGENWVLGSGSSIQSWRSVAYGNGKYVAVGYETSDVMISSDGINWETHPALSYGRWNEVAFGAGRFVAVSNSGTDRIMTSTDGVNWSSVGISSGSLWSVTYDQGKFVVCGTGVTRTSTDGLTWSIQSEPSNSYWWGVTYGNGLFVAVSYVGSNSIMTSTDGVSWTYRSAPESNSWRGVTYGNGVFVAVGANSIMTSTDGINWTAHSAPFGNWEEVTFSQGFFTAVGDYGIITSSDGASWVQKTAPSASWYGLTFGNGKLIAVANGSSNVTVYSETRGATLTFSAQASSHSGSDDVVGLELTFNDSAFDGIPASSVINAINGNTGLGINFVDEAPSLTYSGTGFSESVSNLGAVDGSIVITLTEDSFRDEDTDGKLEVGSQVSINNVPDGLTPVVTINTTTEAVLTLFGNASTHQVSDNVAEITFEFDDTAFSAFGAQDITNATGPASSSLGVSFSDNPSITFSSEGFEETTANDGSVSGSLIIDLSGDTFAEGIDIGNGITFDNIPAGLIATLTSNSSTQIEITLSGNATDHETDHDLAELLFSMDDVAFSNYNVSAVLNATGTVNSGVGISFADSPVLSYTGEGFEEYYSNNGRLEGYISITLVGDTFNGLSDAHGNKYLEYGVHYTITNLPSGLMPRMGTWETTAQLSFLSDGLAEAHQPSDDISDLIINFNDAAFTSVSAENIINATNASTGVGISFNYARGSLSYSGGFTESDQNDGSLEGSMVVTLTGDTFSDPDMDDLLTHGSQVYVSTPYPLTPKLVLLSSTQVEVTLEGNANDHENTNDQSYLTITFYDQAFTNSNSAEISNARDYQNGITLDFNDNAGLTYSGDGFSETSENKGVVSGSMTIDLINDTFADPDGDGLLTVPGQLNLQNLPAGLTPVAILTSTSQMVLTLTGKAVDHESSNDVPSLNFQFTDEAFTLTAAQYVANATDPYSEFFASGIGIDFENRPEGISFEGNGFKEVLANDGSVEGEIKIFLAGETFEDDGDGLLDLSSQVTLGNVPSGLTPNLSITSNNLAGYDWASTFHSGDGKYVTVTYGDGLFVALANHNTHRLATSPDGLNWTKSTSLDIAEWSSVTYGNGIFVAVCYSGTYFSYTSTDGVNWTPGTAMTEIGWQKVVYANGIFVATQSSGANRVMTSTDGVNWSVNAGDSNIGSSLAYGNGKFVSFDYYQGQSVAVSTDGINWTAHAVSASDSYYLGMNGIAFGNGKFVIVCDYVEDSGEQNSNVIITSVDGINWTMHEIANTEMYGVVYGEGIFIANGYNDVSEDNGIYISEDGQTWEILEGVPGFGWNEAIFANGGFVTVNQGWVNEGWGSYQIMTSFPNAEATLTLTGNADSHQSADDIADITFEFTDAAFTNSLAVNVLNATGPASSGLGVDFENNPPANDDCANPQVLSVYQPGEGMATEGSTEFGVPNTESSPCTEESNIRDVWYSFNSGESGQVIFTVEAGENTTIGGAIYAACGEIYQIPHPLGAFPACALDQSELLLLTLTPNTDYLLQVWSPDGDEGDFTVLLEANAPPVIDQITDKTLDEETEIQFTVTATDDFLPLGNIEFVLHEESVNLGMNLDSQTGAFSWIPTEDQGGVYEVVVYALDYLSELTYSVSYTSDTFNITVNEVNVAPVLNVVEDQSATVGQTMTIAISGSDRDLPSNVLTFSLDPISLDKGMSINSATGGFSWSPTSAGAGTSNAVTVTLSDGFLSDDVSFLINVEKLDQAITFDELADKTYGDAPFDLTATGGGSGYAVTFTSSDETVASISGSTVTIVGAGTATITASQSGNDNYSAALDVQQTLTIEKASQAITFGALADKTYGDAAFDLTATGGASGHAVTFTSSDETVASVSGSTVTIVGAGTATITASQAGNDNYSAALDVRQTLTIEKASQAITFAALADKTYGDAAFDLIATGGASGHAVTFTSSDETVASVSGSTVTIVGAGTATITASQSGNDNYSAALDVQQTLTIEKASQAITFAALADKTYGDAAFDLSATGGGSGHAVTFTSSDETVASVSGSTVTIVGAGTATITASQAGNDNYSAALDVTQSLTIGKASQAITFAALADKTYGDAAFDLTATGGASGHEVTFTSSDETVASVSGSTVTIVGAGTATITASQAGNDNYSSALDITQSLNIGQASLMVSAGDEFRMYGEVNPGFTIAYQGFIGDDSEADLETVPTASTLATQTSDVGTYAITVSGGVAQNYAFTYTDGTLTINKAQAKVTLENLTQTADGTARSPTVTTNPAALNYSMTFDGSSTLPTQAGTYVVEVTVLETNYEGSATGNFVLTKAVALGALPLVNEVKVYPNPASERLTVSGDDGLLVKIYDISGVLLLEHEINQTIAIDRLRAGVYLLQVSDANGRVVSHQRVVKY